jgi:hypothetical protein
MITPPSLSLHSGRLREQLSLLIVLCSQQCASPHKFSYCLTGQDDYHLRDCPCGWDWDYHRRLLIDLASTISSIEKASESRLRFQCPAIREVKRQYDHRRLVQMISRTSIFSALTCDRRPGHASAEQGVLVSQPLLLRCVGGGQPGCDAKSDWPP